MNLKHLQMLDCLLDEVYLEKWPYGKEQLHDKDVIASLFAYYVPFDPRFPLRRHHKGYLIYREYSAEEAICAFLGLEVTVTGKPSTKALRFIYRHFHDTAEAREWLRWECQKMEGYTNKRDQIWKGHPREFPE